jgi:hypothetical protein
MSAFKGTPLVGASVTSGAISAVTAIGAGDIKVNTVSVPAMSAAASNEARVDQLVAAINSIATLTGVVAVKVTSTTYKLTASQNIVIAALAGTATLANCGLTAATTAFAAGAILSTRKQFGTNKSGSDDDVVAFGKQWITVREAKELGLLDTLAGADVEVAPVAAYTVTKS